MCDLRSLGDLYSYDPHPLQQGANQRFLCPMCGSDKPRDNEHRSLSLLTATGAYICFRCNARGRLSERVRELSCAMREAMVVRRNSRIDTTVVGSQETYTSEQLERIRKANSMYRNSIPIADTYAADYLLSRSIDIGIAARCGTRYKMNWFGSQAVVFPGYDAQGELKAAQGRFILPGREPNKMSCGPTSRALFSTFKLSSKGQQWPDRIAIVEAPIDALSYFQLSGIHSVATFGSGMQRWLLPLLRQHQTYVELAHDSDSAGDEAATRWANALMEQKVAFERKRPFFENDYIKDWNNVLTKVFEPVVKFSPKVCPNTGKEIIEL